MAEAVKSKFEIEPPDKSSSKFEVEPPDRSDEIEIPDANAQAAAAIKKPILQDYAHNTGAQLVDDPDGANSTMKTRLDRAGAPGSFEGHPGNMAPVGAVSTRLGRLSDKMAAKRDAAEVENLRRPGGAKFNDPAMAYDALHRLTKIGAGVTSPESVAITGGMMVAPEVVGPALVAHGSYQALAHGEKALQGNPEEAEAALLGGAEAAGGGAGASEGFKSWKTADPSLIGRGAQAVRDAVGVKRLSPAKAAEIPAAAEFQPALGHSNAEVLHHAAKEGINLTEAQGTGAPLAKMKQALGERALVGSDKLAEGIDKNAGAFIKSVRDFSDRVDPKASGLSEESAGEAIKQSAAVAKDVSHTNASDAFKNLSFADKAPVDPAPMSKAWAKLREDLPMGAEEKILAETPRNMHAAVEEMLSPTGMKTQLPFKSAIALRSLFRELGESETLPTRVQGAFRQMSKTTDGAMESTATKGGFTKEWRDANAGWKSHVEKYGDRQSPLYKILKQADPAKITRDILNRGSAKDIEILRNEKMDGALEPLRRQVVSDIAKNKFTVGKDGLAGYSDAFLNTLFGKAGLNELYLKANIGRRFNWQQNPSGTSNVMVAEHQVTHPEPTKLGMLAMTAKNARPRPATDFLPEHVFRARDVGNPSIGTQGHAHATMTLEEAQRLAPGRAQATGNPQEVRPIRLSRMDPHEYDFMHRPGEAPWVRFNRQLTDEDYDALPGDRANRLAPAGTSAMAVSSGRRRLPRISAP